MSKFTLGQRQFPTLGLRSQQPKKLRWPNVVMLSGLNIPCVRVTCKVRRSSRTIVASKGPISLFKQGTNICKGPFLRDFTFVN